MQRICKKDIGVNLDNKYISNISIMGKSAPDSEQLKNRIEAGVKKFEIQLMSNDIDVNNILELVNDIDVISVHTPIIYYDFTHWGEMLLTDLFTEKYKRVFYETCRLANILAENNNHDVIVVIHCDISIFELKKYELEKIENVLITAANMYPKILVGLENISPLRNEPLRLNNGWFMGPAEIAEYLNKTIHEERFITILDICHMQMAQYLLESYKDSEIYKSFPGFALEDYLESYVKTLKLIHLNKAEADGYGKKHGLVAPTDLVKRVLKFFYDKKIEIPYICIEVKEKDYNKCANYLLAYENVSEAIKEMYDEQFAAEYNEIA